MTISGTAASSVTASSPTWQERITGRWAISWQVIVIGTLVTYPQIVLTGGTLGSREVLPDQLPTMALVTAGSACVAVSFAVIVDFTLFRHRRVRPIPLWQYFAFYLIAGFIYAAGMEVADDLLGVDSIIPVWVRFLFAGLTTVVFGMVMSLLLEARDRFQRERASLMEQEVALAAERLREDGIIDGLQRSLRGEVDEALRRARERILGAAASSEPSANQEAWRLVAEEVGSAARDSVRPLSHSLWEQAEMDFPKPRLSGALRQFLSAPRFLPAVTAAFIGIGLPGAAIRAVGPAWAPVLIGVAMAGVYGILRLADTFMARASRLRQVWFIVGYLATLVIVLTVAFGPGVGPASGGEALAIVIGVTTAVVVISFVGALDDVRAQAIASLQTAVAQAQISQEAQRRELALTLASLAQHLHGSVQTRLTMCAAGVERAAGARDSAAYQDCVDEALEVLGGQVLPGEWSGDIESDLTQIQSLWAGLCSVEVHVDPAVPTAVRRSDIAVVVAEAVGNAYRHGAAEQVRVDVRPMGEIVRVTVSDNGTGPTGAGPGLGLAMMSRLGRGRVSLEATESGGLLVVDLPS